MSTPVLETPFSPPGSPIFAENLLFDYPEADVILRSCDSFEFRVLKLYIVHSSPILGEKVLISPNPQLNVSTITADSESDVDTSSLPVVQLSDSGAILFSLLSYIFPVPPILPATIGQTMELLSVAQKYKMDVILTHIRNHIAQQDPPFIREDTAFHVYSLSQQYGLRREALQAARSTLSFSNLTIEELEDELDMMPGVFLHELWKYHQSVRSNLTVDLEEFRTLHARGTLVTSSCESLADSGIPSWLDHYIVTIGSSPTFFDLTKFYKALSSHVQKPRKQGGGGCASCAFIPHKTIGTFWAALTAVVNSSIANAESDLLLSEETRSDSHTTSIEASSPPKYSDMTSADVILRSTDLVNFRVHRSVLVTSSPFFADMFSLPQPANDEVIDGLPVVRLSEDVEVLNSLISILYPVPPEIPSNDDSILALLAASQKYDMVAVQSSIRAEVSRRGLLSPKGAETFRVYAIACRQRLIPEMETTARLTLDYPMTFDYLGEALRSFEGCALRDLAHFRQRCRDSLTSCFASSLDHRNGPSKIWVGCPTVFTFDPENDDGSPPIWLGINLGGRLAQSKASTYAFKPPSFRKEYLEALQAHVEETDCHFCTKMHTLKGEAFCAEVENMLAQAQNVQYSSFEGIWGV
ncbi:hypothetical protein BJV78DRAFT_851427 [Lactifluus subvellereus]|nr:hypothetical protein BJV78DRAFT_851427 [Lactifluus subvellereus]